MEKAKLNLYLMTGQSNACHCITWATKANPIPQIGTAYYYGSNWSYSELDSDATFHSMIGTDGFSMIGDKAPSFAAKYYELTDCKSYFVCGAIGGQNIFTFDPDNGKTWQYMQKTLSNAIDAVDKTLFDLHIESYIWIQGEADINTPIEIYKTAFVKMHNALLNGGMGIKFNHCFISKIRGDYNSAQAQIELARECPRTITMATTIADSFTVENGLMHTDDLHYLQAGDDLIGSHLGITIGHFYNENGPTLYNLE